ncbi:MAG: hypothetical protein RI988_3558 [Pseudomonadota bacterium]|jgi:predicted O-methyltransferase YrrM
MSMGSGMRGLVEAIKYSPLGRVASMPLRAQVALVPTGQAWLRGLHWVLTSREYTTPAFDHDELGVLACAAALSQLTGVPAAQVREYAQELLTDDAFRARHDERLRQTRLRHIRDPRLRLGRCLMTYMLVRTIGARVVFEAGTDNGMGSLAVLRALRRNHPAGGGLLVTIDIRADRGDFLVDDESGWVRRLTGDSVQALRQAGEPIDVLLHDTVNDPDHTRAQLQAALPHLSPRAAIQAAWFSREFASFCEANGFGYLEYGERPHRHWYGGGRCALAVRREPPPAPAVANRPEPG